MDVIHVVPEIVLVSYEMLPVSPLPESCLAFLHTAGTAEALDASALSIGLGKQSLDA